MSAPENDSASDIIDDQEAASADAPENAENTSDDAASGEPGEGDAADASDVSDATAKEETESDADKQADTPENDGSATEDAPVELDIESLSAALAIERSRADENWDRVLRMQADMENQRKRSQRDVQNARKFALEGMINDLLPVRDSLEMGITAASQTDADISSIVEGSELTLKMLSQAFEKYNIEEVNPVDQKFNPEFHQAMSMQEIEGRDSNTVVNVLQKGYTLNDRLIRPALVIVAK